VAVTKADIDEVVITETHVKAENLIETATLTDLEIDSLDMVSIVFALEDKYGISLTTEDVTGIETYKQFIDLIAVRAA
jgi:acyl carrier protein